MRFKFLLVAILLSCFAGSMARLDAARADSRQRSVSTPPAAKPAARGSSGDNDAELLTPSPLAPEPGTDGPLMPTGAAPPQSGIVRVARWRGDKAAAMTFTLDDGIIDQATLGGPMLEQFGFHGTFFICPGRTPELASEVKVLPGDKVAYGSWEHWRALAAAGHEIASHTWDHLALTQINTSDRLATEIVRSRDHIQAELGQPCLTFAYPFNITTPASSALVDQTYVAAAGGERRWYGGHHFRAAMANKFVDMAIRSNGWDVAMIHAIEHGYGEFSSREVLREHLRYVSLHADQLWVDTYSNVSRYQREIAAASLNAQAAGTSAETFAVQCPALNGNVFNVPLTVVLRVPHATRASATRGGQSIAVNVRRGELLLDVVPGPQPVSVSWE